MVLLYLFHTTEVLMINKIYIHLPLPQKLTIKTHKANHQNVSNTTYLLTWCCPGAGSSTNDVNGDFSCMNLF